MIILEILHFHDLSTLPLGWKRNKCSMSMLKHNNFLGKLPKTKDYMNTCREPHAFFVHYTVYYTWYLDMRWITKRPSGGKLAQNLKGDAAFKCCAFFFYWGLCATDVNFFMLNSWWRLWVPPNYSSCHKQVFSCFSVKSDQHKVYTVCMYNNRKFTVRIQEVVSPLCGWIMLETN